MKAVYWYFVGLFLTAVQGCANDMNRERAYDDMVIAVLSVLSHQLLGGN